MKVIINHLTYGGKLNWIPDQVRDDTESDAGGAKPVDMLPIVCYSHKVKLYQQQCWYRLQQKKSERNNLYEDLV